MIIDPNGGNNIPEPIATLANTTPIVCSECQGTFFRQVMMLRKASKLMLGAVTDQILPALVLRCDDCGEPLADTIPNG